MLPQTLATVYKSCAVSSCAAQIPSCGCIRVTSCSEQRGVIFKLAWSCRGAVLDHLRTQFRAVNAISPSILGASLRRGHSVHLRLTDPGPRAAMFQEGEPAPERFPYIHPFKRTMSDISEGI